MRIKRMFLLSAVFLSICVGWFCVSLSQADEDKAAQPKSKLVLTAEAALEATQAQFQFQQATVEDVYIWSRRLLEAERANGAGQSALTSHVARMANLRKKVAALRMAGAPGGSPDKYFATTFYLLEAKQLEQAQ